MRKFFAALVVSTVLAGTGHAASIYPIDRATILAGSPFDFKVEFGNVVKPEDVKITINGQDYKSVLGKDAQFVAEEKNKDKILGSSVILRGVTIANAGDYKVEIAAGAETKKVTWNVYGTADKPAAKNVIFFLGDGLSVAHRTAARIMSKGVTEGKANGRLNMDSLDRMAFIGTSAADSVTTDSANTMSAYMTGHKGAVNSLGVYADRTPDTLDDPKVETLGEALRRQTNKAIGIVATSEIQDATPAAIVSHTRRRDDKAEITGMLLDVKPEVVLGGGSAYFLPQATNGSKRKDDKDYIKLFQDAGYKLATDKTELASAAGSDKVLGLFHTGNMDVTWDREFSKKGSVGKFPNQPGLVEMTKAALDNLSKSPNGFFLMVEASNIDKMTHPLDNERAVIDTIEFDQAIGVAQDFIAKNPDTLLVVTGDHTHGITIVGTVDDTVEGTEMREKVGGRSFTNYTDENKDGYPDKLDVTKRLAMFVSNYPDHYETFRPKLDGPFTPALQNDKKEYVANEAYKDVPGAVFVQGNLPKGAASGAHTVDDVVLQATGPGSEGFKGYMEQSDVYKVLADALALGVKQTN